MWPTEFPVPPATYAAGSGSVGGASTNVMVAVYTSSQHASEAYDFYVHSDQLIVSDARPMGAASRPVGTLKFTGPFVGSLGVTGRDTTYIVVVLNTAEPSISV
jgi:hypothetical protein